MAINWSIRVTNIQLDKYELRSRKENKWPNEGNGISFIMFYFKTILLPFSKGNGYHSEWNCMTNSFSFSFFLFEWFMKFTWTVDFELIGDFFPKKKRNGFFFLSFIPCCSNVIQQQVHIQHRTVSLCSDTQLVHAHTHVVIRNDNGIRIRMEWYCGRIKSAHQTK